MPVLERFQAQHVAQAARLFAARYSQYRQANNLLPAQFSEPAAVESRLHEIMAVHPGMVVLEAGKVAGYLIGYTGLHEFKGTATGVYVPVWGHGTQGAPAENRQNSDEIFTALYAEMASVWVERRCSTHAITYFVPDSSLESLLFGLGFGLLVVDGIRSMSPIVVADSDRCEVRAAGEADLAAVLELDGKLAEHLRGAPIFLNTNPVAAEDAGREFWGSDTRAYVAWDNGRPIAGMRGVLNMGPGCDLLDLTGSLGVNFAFTDPDARQLGVATRLLNELIAWGSERGMARCVVDFESANLEARAFWLRHFKPIFHSAIRRIDERI